MTVYTETFHKIAEEIEIVDMTKFRHADLGMFSLPGDLEVPESDNRPLLLYLWRVLYFLYHAGDQFSILRFLTGSKRFATLPEQEDSAFVETLRAAHPGRGQVSTGWTVIGPRHDDCLVTKNGLTLRVQEQDLLAGAGETVGLRMPAERRYALPGWYIVIGDARSTLEGGPLIRLYFTIAEARRAPGFLRTAASQLNVLQVPFQMKVANHPRSFERRDPCVISVTRTVWEWHRPVFEGIYYAHQTDLRDDYPRFALRLAPGVSFAEEPDTGTLRMSFGEHRCLLIAEALLTAFQNGSGRSAEDRMAAIALRYSAEGLDVGRPYLNAHSPPYKIESSFVNGHANTIPVAESKDGDIAHVANTSPVSKSVNPTRSDASTR